jgi:hypothetical protein
VVLKPAPNKTGLANKLLQYKHEGEKKRLLKSNEHFTHEHDLQSARMVGHPDKTQTEYHLQHSAFGLL